MKVSVFFFGLAATAVFLAATTDAQAKPFKLKGTFTRQQVAAACAAAGAAGDTVAAGGVDATTGGYGCDNITQGTTVSCDAKGHCTGIVPGKQVIPEGTGLDLLNAILGGSDMVMAPQN